MIFDFVCHLSNRAPTIGLPFSFGVFEKYYTKHEPFASQTGVPAIGTTSLVGTRSVSCPSFGILLIIGNRASPTSSLHSQVFPFKDGRRKEEKHRSSVLYWYWSPSSLLRTLPLWHNWFWPKESYTELAGPYCIIRFSST